MNLTALPPDPDELNNKRAKAAERALLYFARDFGETGESGELDGFAEQNLSDLLADVAHYCDRKGLKILTCLTNARSNYEEETDGVGIQFAD